MALRLETLLERQCQADRNDGQPCEAYACHGHVYCFAHGGRPSGEAPLCDCGSEEGYGSYGFPHRPGGGPGCVLSRDFRLSCYKIGPSEHSEPRLRGIEKAIARALS